MSQPCSCTCDGCTYHQDLHDAHVRVEVRLATELLGASATIRRIRNAVQKARALNVSADGYDALLTEALEDPPAGRPRK